MMLVKIKALILAGGKGTRLRPLTHTIPKQLVPLANRPIIHYVVDQLSNAGIQDIVVIVSPETSKQVISSLKPNPWNANFTFVTQPEPLGLAHALLTAETFLRNSKFIMYLGDNLMEDSLDTFLKEFIDNSYDALLLTQKVPDPSKFGVLVFNGDHKLVDLIEKPQHPPSPWALVGVYFFTPKIFDMAKRIKPSPRGEYEITDTIRELMKSGGKIGIKKLKGWWLDTGKKDDLLVANLKVLKSMHRHEVKGKVSPNSKVTPPLILGSNSIIENSKIVGPVSIGNGVVIRNSRIGHHVSIGNKSLIEDAQLEDCVVLDEVTLKFVILENSIIGRRAKILGKMNKVINMQVFISDDSEIIL